MPQELQAKIDGLKREYCLGDFTRCARFRVAKELGSEAVPILLIPDSHRRADILLRENRVAH